MKNMLLVLLLMAPLSGFAGEVGSISFKVVCADASHNSDLTQENLNEKISEAAINPNTNFGKRSQTIPNPGFCVVSTLPAFFRNAHQPAIKKAATPIKTF